MNTCTINRCVSTSSGNSTMATVTENVAFVAKAIASGLDLGGGKLITAGYAYDLCDRNEALGEAMLAFNNSITVAAAKGMAPADTLRSDPELNAIAGFLLYNSNLTDLDNMFPEVIDLGGALAKATPERIEAIKLLIEIDSRGLIAGFEYFGIEPSEKRTEWSARLKKAFETGLTQDHLSVRYDFDRAERLGSDLQNEWFKRWEDFGTVSRNLAAIGDTAVIATWASDAHAGWRHLLRWAVNGK